MASTKARLFLYLPVVVYHHKALFEAGFLPRLGVWPYARPAEVGVYRRVFDAEEALKGGLVAVL